MSTKFQISKTSVEAEKFFLEIFSFFFQTTEKLNVRKYPFSFLPKIAEQRKDKSKFRARTDKKIFVDGKTKRIKRLRFENSKISKLAKFLHLGGNIFSFRFCLPFQKRFIFFFLLSQKFKIQLFFFNSKKATSPPPKKKGSLWKKGSNFFVL